MWLMGGGEGEGGGGKLGNAGERWPRLQLLSWRTGPMFGEHVVGGDIHAPTQDASTSGPSHCVG